MSRIATFGIVALVLANALSPAQERPPAKKSTVVSLYFPNDKVVRGELLSMTSLSISLYVDGKLESYNPALQKVLAVHTAEGWQVFDAEKKKFVAATEEQVQKVVGKTATRLPAPVKPESRSAGPVLLVNTNKETIRVTTKSFIDATGQKHILVRTIDVKPGASDMVEDLDGNAIRAAQISFTLITKNGSSEWSAGMREFDGTAIQVVVSGDKIMTATVVAQERENRVFSVMRQVQDHLFAHYFAAWGGDERVLKAGDPKKGEAPKERRRPATPADAPAEFKKSREAKLMDTAGLIAILYLFPKGSDLHGIAVTLDHPRYRSYFSAIRTSDRQGRDLTIESALANTFADMQPEHRKELMKVLSAQLTDKKDAKQPTKDELKKQLEDRSPALANSAEVVDMAHEVCAAYFKARKMGKE